MKSMRNLLTASLLTAVTMVAAAADTTTPPPPPPGAHGWHHRGGPEHLLGKLGMSDAQKQQVKAIMSAAQPQMQSLHEQMRANMLKLQQTRPSDPNYASIVAATSQTHGSLSAQMLSQHSDVRVQLFKVLTPAQQDQLAALEAPMATRKHGEQPPGE